ncbi:triose-phosphate isomerase [Segetibacter sp. 3557_3]|uniref:triose-phosphate isomerase n=1 Tax=Segetibacter sp. 3557_3 TaxID=2547429 RepID=UPI00105861F7|nr:triose-phosphate isomerase [Segetibacter sp. 3557_3]TDH28040.1 triose-phosphate isomerase [Segetibacter sp. 3557_3]
MRYQIAAANWKMNLSWDEADNLLTEVLSLTASVKESQRVVFAVPAPYLDMAVGHIADKFHMHVAAQNCHSKKSGAFTGEISVQMLNSVEVEYVIIGHSERREYFNESNQFLAEKIDIALEYGIKPIFCCGEALPIRESGGQNEFVSTQLQESLYHLSAEQVKQVVIAYEPIWAIGTGKTASSEQAQEMHAHIRSELAGKYGREIADQISILYGGSVKASNAKEIFHQPDVDGGLVGGASLVAEEFVAIINALK